jgi:threonine dehydrogenase-like Zn-dependent dehydrogenase
MRAFVLSGPGSGSVEEVPEPVAGPGTVVVAVDRVGVCGTDAEFFRGDMAYLHERPARAVFPMRLGHEWCGVVAEVGPGVDTSWLGRRVTGDTMLGCRRCTRCRDGRQHLCADRFEIGIRGGWPGALAERLPVPVTALHSLPEPVGVVAGALVEPGGNALRAVQAAGLPAGQRLLICGSGTIGLLAGLFAQAKGIAVAVTGKDAPTLQLAASLGMQPAAGEVDAVIDATFGPDVPAQALDLVAPGGRVVCIGIAGTPSLIDTRQLVFKELTVAGVLSGSPGLRGTIEHYASGSVDPTPLVAATVGLDEAADVLSGRRRPEWGHAPKVHIDPRR